MISAKALDELKEICLEEYGEVISDDEAVKIGIRLLQLFKEIYRPISKDEYEKLKKAQ